jgi:uncharacterized protein with PIN domain
MKPEDLEKQWQQHSQEAFHRLAQWQQAHPKATMAEIEVAIDEHLDQVRARMIEEMAQAEQESMATQVHRCPHCGSRMSRRGSRQRTLQTRGHQQVAVSRDYQSCPACGYSFFPPR